MTLGLTSQREMDTLVAAAAKKAGIDTSPDLSKLGEDKAALVAELQAEREAAAAAAEAALRGEVPSEPTTALERGEALFRK